MAKTDTHATTTQELEERIKGLEKLEEDILANIKALYPVGKTVYWLHGRHQRKGHILEHLFAYGGLRLATFRIQTPSGARVRIGVHAILHETPARLAEPANAWSSS